jgi:hypothetical protein
MKVPLSCFIFGVTLLFGSSVVVDSPKRITREWESKVLGIQYGVTTLDNAVDEMVSGLIDEIFDKKFIGRIKSEIDKNRVGEGEYLEYWPNGNLKARLPYKEGKAHGHLHGWHKNGKDAFKGFFHEGLKQGIHITFFEAESRENLNKARLLTYSDKGKLDGDQNTYHPNGRLWICIPYKKGIAHGALEGWDGNRKPFLAAQYKKGVLQKRPPPPPIKRPREKRIEHKYVDEVSNELIKIARKEFGVVAYGTGGAMPFDVETISVSFHCMKKGTVEEARELMVKLTERFAMIINKHEKLRPYFREYPFSKHRAKIDLAFIDSKGLHYSDGSVYYVFIGDDKKICYFSANPQTPKKDNEFEESYEDAVKIVHGEKK